MTKHRIDVTLRNSEQWILSNAKGQTYLIQASWPLNWRDKAPLEAKEVPIIYIMDGNALFLTATEAAWRRASGPHYSGGGLVVAIGYDLPQEKLYSPSRGYDLTPPDGTEKDVFGPVGGADEMLDFMTNTVFPSVLERFPDVTFGRRALFGHSYGGLFALHALFKRPRLFDCYIASSPSLYWHDDFIFSEQEEYEKEPDEGNSGAVVMLYYGELEAHPKQWHDQTDEAFERRKKMLEGFKFEENTHAMYEKLRASPRVRDVHLRVYSDEDHTSVMACALSRSLTTFFEDWAY
ncbi:uncharacterized protein PV09_01617 [Verruconis gallopava]|uniref:Uncharacterized protein n=1 Tax=Verruconis gallopava TaxID=253628 RepID=A0A0D1Z3X1_9PEZI|nr:uncharacterized protein PV09_01617 [Verruconis gallopava]KIW07677.1 hypothetical protein PV09_01617 [Verruconis gallopava]